jgi:hypothetical protein
MKSQETASPIFSLLLVMNSSWETSIRSFIVLFLPDFTLKENYATKDIIKPPLFHYDRQIFNQRIEFSAYVDYWLHTNPREPVNWRYYKFPSTYVGNWSVARALAYLYKTNPKTENLASENTLYVSKDYNHEVVENLVAAERVRFRKKFNIDEGATVFYTLPGRMMCPECKFE